MEKELLLKDLCARLPYDVKVQCYKYPHPVTILYVGNINEVKFAETGGIEHINSIKPYLRPMSSMTEEERKEFTKLFCKWHDDELFDYIEEGTEFSIWKHKGISPVVFDWLNSHHFDYRRLIEKGLALTAPEGMYN